MQIEWCVLRFPCIAIVVLFSLFFLPSYDGMSTKGYNYFCNKIFSLILSIIIVIHSFVNHWFITNEQWGMTISILRTSHHDKCPHVVRLGYFQLWLAFCFEPLENSFQFIWLGNVPTALFINACYTYRSSVLQRNDQNSILLNVNARNLSIAVEMMLEAWWKLMTSRRISSKSSIRSIWKNMM